MKNAIFGKIMENVCNRIDVKLVTQWESRYGAEAMNAKPNFHSHSIFSENLIAIKLCKLEVKFSNRYTWVYASSTFQVSKTLQVSKIHIYEFHNKYMAPLQKMQNYVYRY